MRIEFIPKQHAKILAIEPLSEKRGQTELVPAVAITLRVSLPTDRLGLLDPTLRDFLFREGDKVQGELVPTLVLTDAAKAIGAFGWEGEQTGTQLNVYYGISGDMNQVLKDGTKRFSHGIRDVADPLNTITASGVTAGLVTSNLIKLRGTSKEGLPVTEPLHTISSQGLHHAEVRAFLIKYYGTDQDPRLTEPMHTIPTKDRFGLVTVKGQPYAIVDIGLRMLKPRELYRAQGFKDSYIIDWGIHPHTGEKIKITATASIRMCGNSVCPPMARAYVAANYSERQPLKAAA